MSGVSKGFAAVIAVAAWAGLAAQFDASLARTGSAGAAAWAMLRYFTVITNLLLAIVFTGVALQRRGFAAPPLLGGMTLAIVLVGAVYGLLLRDLVDLSGGAKIADILLHHVTPVLTPLFWLAYVVKGRLRRRDPWVWAIFPATYFAYALVRGRIEGLYAYPFMDVGQLGWARTGANAAVILLGFILVGHVALWLDGRLVSRLKPA